MIRSAVALVAAGSLLGLAACADPDDTSEAGTTLAVLTTEAVQTVAPTSPPTTLGPGMVSGTSTEYEVKAGDYLSGIATRFKVDLTELVNFNEWADGTNHQLHPGNVIKIPPGFTMPDETPSTTAAPTSTGETTGEGDAATTSPPSTVDTSQGGTYTVVDNDYLGGIAKKVDATVEAIIAANAWPEGADHKLYPGDVIKIP